TWMTGREVLDYRRWDDELTGSKAGARPKKVNAVCAQVPELLQAALMVTRAEPDEIRFIVGLNGR
ncbi:MAG: hypothetical protein AAF449_08465, partial [Myxococcota bacterium]